MASKDSGELAWGSGYNLGDYSFRIERSSVPGSTNDKIEAICTDKDGKNARKSIQVPSGTQITGWYVEANETEASVYISTKQERPDIGNIDYPFPFGSSDVVTGGGSNVYTHTDTAPAITTYVIPSGTNYSTVRRICASGEAGAVAINTDAQGIQTPHPITSEYTYLGKKVYYTTYEGSWYKLQSAEPRVSGSDPNYAGMAWIMIYGDPEGTADKIVGRFAIDIEDSGGVGPGSDWVDPGDYDPEWEEGDPTHTLYVEVTGALSGRHNDPIVDPSYSYIPADKDTVKDYGCGGDGGHGGGGGAGASTVVIHKFATNQANSKEITALARRHGYGSGGGKGGKGGDGCILVYY